MLLAAANCSWLPLAFVGEKKQIEIATFVPSLKGSYRHSISLATDCAEAIMPTMPSVLVTTAATRLQPCLLLRPLLQLLQLLLDC